MDGITDFPFRQIQAKYAKPSIMLTEFTNVEGMFLASHDHLLNDLMYHKSQRPIIAQIFGSTPNYFYKAALVCAELGFDGIDINMGCPAKNVAHHGGGAALIADPPKAKEIIKATQKGMTDWVNGKNIVDIGLSEEKIQKIYKLKVIAQLSESELENYPETVSLSENQRGHEQRLPIPISVKTRIGITENVVIEWVHHLLETNPQNISIHGRTLKQMYTGCADWEAIGKAAEVIKKTKTTVLGNGDILSIEDAHAKIHQYNLDGVLIGRAAMGNPYLFKQKQITPREKLQIALKHASLHANFKSEKLFLQMRKHFSFYISNFPYANDIKIKLIHATNFEEARSILTEEINKLNPEL